jgi:Protein of unknown function (DUF4242)
MPLFLIEDFEPAAAVEIASATDRSGGRLVEARTAADHTHVFAVAEHHSWDRLATALEEVEVIGADDVAEVRLVGADLADVHARSAPRPRYLVEWDLPTGLDMATYLTRNASTSPLYAQIPEVILRRTYVREDLGKSMCLYNADNAADVRRARDLVQTPVDRLYELS